MFKPNKWQLELLKQMESGKRFVFMPPRRYGLYTYLKWLKEKNQIYMICILK